MPTPINVPAVKPPPKPLLVVGQGWRTPWLDAWEAHEPVPVPVEAVNHAIMLVDAALAPANPCVVAVEVERTLALFGAPENWGDIADFYLEAFEDVPLDLVHVALKHARKSLKFFPRPAELLAPIRGELEERRHAARRLRVAADRARRAERVDDPPLIDEERKTAVRAVLEAVGIKRMSDARAEQRPPMGDHR